MQALVLVAVSLGLSNFAAAVAMGVSGIDARTRLRVVIFGLFEIDMSAALARVGPALRSRDVTPRAWDAAPRGGLRGAASVSFCGLCYGVTELTDVPQLARPSLVPPQVPMVTVNFGGRQFGNWM